MGFEGFPERLKRVVKESGESADVFAKWIGVGRAALYTYMNGKKIPWADTVAAVCEHRKVDPGWLLLGREAAAPGWLLLGKETAAPRAVVESPAEQQPAEAVEAAALITAAHPAVRRLILAEVTRLVRASRDADEVYEARIADKESRA